MSLIKYIDLFIGAIINVLLCIFIAKTVFNIQNTKDKKTIVIVILIASILISIINLFNKNTFKILFIFPFMVLAFKNIFKINYKTSITYFFIVVVYLFMAELLTALLFSLLPFDYAFLFNNVLGTTIGAIIVSIFCFPILKIKKLILFFNNIVEVLDEKSKNVIITILLLTLGALTYKNTTETENLINIVVNIIVSISILLIIYLYYIETKKSKELSKNYNIMLNYLEKYEKELVEKRKIIHDYKNQLIVINGYIGDDKKLKEYLKELLNEQKEIKESSLFRNIDKLPRGLKGLIYYKLSYISNDIKVNLQVLSSLRKFDKLSSKVNKDTLKIIGILLDNAIEAVEHEKDKNINIEFSIIKNKFRMLISNNCNKNIQKANIMKTGYSTKGRERGYGLALINEILKQEKNIKLNIDIVNNEFITDLEVEI